MKRLRYEKIREAYFLSRPNRFIARVALAGVVRTVHVKNTGRCRELLRPGSPVILAESDKADRKTPFDLIAVEKKREDAFPLLINMDAQAPNAAAEEWLRAGGLIPVPDLVRREVTYRDSRFDFYLEKGERRAFVEVKGVTLEDHGEARFPDAPTERGAKHLRGLVRAKSEGFEAYVLFLIQMKGPRVFRPNEETDPAFAAALRKAAAAGVGVLAFDCMVEADRMAVSSAVRVEL